MEGAAYYYYEHPEEPGERLAGRRAQEALQGAPPDFFTGGGFIAAMAVVTALKKTDGSTDTEKLIAAMEGMKFDTPKGKMIFRKEDHQALQPMYPLQDQGRPERRLGDARAGARDHDRRDEDPDQERPPIGQAGSDRGVIGLVDRVAE